MSRFSQLAEWLTWMETLHSQEIDLGLERVFTVAIRLGLIEKGANSEPFSGCFPLPNTQVISVAGTNGKGSCCATLVACLMADGQRVGSFTSPHFEHYCERICVDNRPVDESLVCEAFDAIDQARAEISLTYFEFGTLAALWVFKALSLPYVVLEVGLGGRLDAVNIVDADIAVVTSVDLDHQDWLGNDRNSISFEKLGIARQGKPLIIAEQNLTRHLQQAASLSDSYLINRDFSLGYEGGSWCFALAEQRYQFSKPRLHPDSMAAAFMAAHILGHLPTGDRFKELTSSLSLTGRFQQRWVDGTQIILDVAHNPAAARSLRGNLQNSGGEGQTLAVFAVLSDKDYESISQQLSPVINRWYLGDLVDIPRGLPSKTLETSLKGMINVNQVIVYPSIDFAIQNALKDASEHDRIVVFGSFFTVATVNRWLSEHYPD